MTTPPSTMNYRRHFLALALAASLLLTAIVTVNYLVDPYFIHQWDTALLTRPSPAQQKFTPWAKTYAAYRYQPEVVYLGSSRTEIGLPVEPGVFAGKRVLNLAMKGGSLGDAVDMLEHTSFFHRPEIVVWGLDYGWLFHDGYGNMDFRRTLVAKDAGYPLWRWLVNVKRSLAPDMTVDAMRILLGLSEQSCQPILASYGTKAAQCVERIMADEGGTAKAFTAAISKYDPPTTSPDISPAMQRLAQVTQDYCAAGTAFRFFIQPAHALAELYWAPRWDDLEDWKRALVRVVDQRQQQGCDIRLLDFSGFNRVTTEEIPQVTGKETMEHYWEHSHYRSAVGARILTQLFAPDPPSAADDFGVALHSDVIERHLDNLRQARDHYCATHPRETALYQNR